MTKKEEESKALITYSTEQKDLIHATVAKGCSETEFGMLLYMAKKMGLDPLTKQIWAVKYNDAPALIFVGRDGYLQIAHRSGQFDGMESGVKEDNGKLVGWAKVHRKDMAHPFCVEVSEKEYNTGKGNWEKMPRIMIQKVAESQALRRAFAISGVYSPEEIDAEPSGSAPAPSHEVIDVTPPVDESKKWKKKPPEIWPKSGQIIDADATQKSGA